MKQKLYTIRLKLLYESGHQAIVKIVSQAFSGDDASGKAAEIVAKWQDVINVECIGFTEVTKFQRPSKTKNQANQSKEKSQFKKSYKRYIN